MTNINPLSFLGGYKTYIVGILMIIAGLLKKDSQMVLMGIGFITTRQAIAKIDQ